MKKWLIFFFIFSTTPVFAGNNISIVCDKDHCRQSSNLLFFDEQNIAPGFTKTQTLTLINNLDTNCDLQFSLKNNSPPNILSSKETISVVADTLVWYAGSIDSLSDNKYHQLGHIDSNQSKSYVWTVSLDKSLGNDLFQQTSIFDIDFNFTCANKSDDKKSQNNQECSDTPPSKIPQNLRAFSGENMVTLSWDEPDDNFTYYLIAYGEDNGAATFGNPNVGAKGTSSYTIKNLSGDTKYFFKIRTGNGCAPGIFSEPISITPGGKILNDFSVDTVFQKNILGVSVTLSENIDKPTNVSCINIFPYAFLLALLTNLILYKYPIITFFISTILFLFDYYLSKFTCQKHPYFYFGSITSFILPLLFFLFFKKNNSSKPCKTDRL